MNSAPKQVIPPAPAEKSSLRPLIEVNDLAKLWGVPRSWIQEYCRDRVSDPIPCFRLGRYVRFDPTDPELAAWLERHRTRKRPRKRLL